MDRKVWLPSGGSLVIDRTEAMTVIDVNTGKFVGSGGNLEETVTKNNIEAAEEIVRQLRLRDIGGIIVIDFIDMVLESNRDLVVRRLLECLGRDRTKHQVAEVTSLGLVQMTRKRVGSGLIEVFSETCDHCNGRGIIVHSEPVERSGNGGGSGSAGGSGHGGSGGSGGSGGGESGGNGGGRSRGRRGKGGGQAEEQPQQQAQQPATTSGPTPAQIAAAAHAAALKSAGLPVDESALPTQDQPDLEVRESESEEQEQSHPAEVPVAQAAAAEARTHAESRAEPAAPADSHAEAPADSHAEAPADSHVEAPSAQAPATQQPAPEPAPATTPKRRRRGRVVAPAGPPRSAAPVVAGEGSDPAGSTPA